MRNYCNAKACLHNQRVTLSPRFLMSIEAYKNIAAFYSVQLKQAIYNLTKIERLFSLSWMISLMKPIPLLRATYRTMQSCFKFSSLMKSQSSSCSLALLFPGNAALYKMLKMAILESKLMKEFCLMMQKQKKRLIRTRQIKVVFLLFQVSTW